MQVSDKIYVAGHSGMVGSAIVRELKRQGFDNLVLRTPQELDLRNQKATNEFFCCEKPDYVFVAAAVVGGIWANMHGHARFLMENLQIECNIIDSAYRYDVKKLLFLGSSCIYPKEALQPISECSLLTGPLEPTNEGYAIAKIAGLKLCEYYTKQRNADFISVMPCNLYGYNDNFDLENSHFLPALIRRFHEAKLSNANTVTVWGSGIVLRELLFVDDLADACLFVMDNYTGADFLNVGYGQDYTIAQIADMVKQIVGYPGAITFDTTKPDGMKRKIVDSTKIRDMGWVPKVNLEQGIKLTYEWYVRKKKGK